MSDDTRLDRAIRWFKNNLIFSTLLLLATITIGASQLVGALSSLLGVAKEIQSSDASTSATNKSAAVSVVAEYGGKGNGPGYFDDARYLTVGSGPEVVVAEFGNRGRVQRLSLTGTPIAQWYMSEDTMHNYSMSGIINDEHGALYIAHFSDLLKRDILTGKALGQVDFNNCEPWITTVGLQSTGPIAICEGNLALLRYNQPQRLTTIKLPIKHDSLSIASRLAIDGDDNIYMLDTESGFVYKLGPDGTFVNRFGGDGMGRGLLHLPSAIAVDGGGDVYISDQNGIHIFTAEGRFLQTLAVPDEAEPSAIREMAFDRNHDIYAIYFTNKLRILRIPKPITH